MSTFYAVTLDGRRILVYAVAGVAILALGAVLLHPHHAAAAGKMGKVTKFIGQEIRRNAPKHPRRPLPHSITPERYLWEKLKDIVRDIGQHRLSGQFPWAPPGAPGAGSGTGLPI